MRVVILFILLFVVASIVQTLVSVRRIPRIIWTYWQGEDKSGIVKKCMETWKRTGYEVRLVTRETISQWIPDVNILGLKCIDSPARIADFLRMFLLYRYGGVWCDASIILTEDFEWLEKKFQNPDIQLFAFYKWNISELHHENWFLAAPQQSPLAKLWLDEALSMCAFDSVDDYVNDCIQKHNVYLPRSMDIMNYLAVYLSLKKVLMKHGTKNISREHTNQFHFDEGYNTLDIYCRRKPKYLIKLTSGDRRKLKEDKGLEECLFKWTK